MLQSKDIGWQNGFKTKQKKTKQTQELTIYCLQETHFRVKDTWMESKGMEKDISCKWKQQESACSNTHIRQNRL